MSLKTLFIYKVTTHVAIWVVIAHSPEDAIGLVYAPDGVDVVTEKLGCVTADMKDVVEHGVVNRQWRCDV